MVENDRPNRVVWEGKGPVRSKAKVVYDLSETDGVTHFSYINEYDAARRPAGQDGRPGGTRVTGDELDRSLDNALDCRVTTQGATRLTVNCSGHWRSVTDFLDEKRKEIDARLKELKPLVDEYHRLEKAAAALAGVGAGTTKRGPVRATAGAARLGHRPPRAPARAAASAPCRPQELVNAKPGITIPELADAMGIQANYLYRVMPGLQKDGQGHEARQGLAPGARRGSGPRPPGAQGSRPGPAPGRRRARRPAPAPSRRSSPCEKSLDLQALDDLLLAALTW